MNNENQRRSFLATCGLLMGMTVFKQSRQAMAADATSFQRSQLVDHSLQPLKLDSLETRREYLFHYPFVSTPCFLIDLGKPGNSSALETASGESYQSADGLGALQSVVAFSAICAHRMTHPTRAVSFIGFRQEPTGFYNKEQDYVRQNDVIQCCSEQSVYDPAQGGRVLAGPAPQPLASIVLENDAEGNIYATGVRGGMMFDDYFNKFGKRLVMEYQRLDVDALVSAQTEVVPMDEYTGKTIECG